MGELHNEILDDAGEELMTIIETIINIVREHDKHEHASFALECSEQARADERDRCVQAIESLDRSDEKALGKHTKNFNKGVNVGLKLSVEAIKAE